MNEVDYKLRANYKYYETGALKRTELAEGLQGIDYVYNLAGQLKAINPNGEESDLFGMQIDYHNNDYKRALTNINAATYGTDQLNGNIKGIRWTNKQVSSQEEVYAYEYDRNNWLEGADFGADGDQTASTSPLVLTNETVEAGEQQTYENATSITVTDSHFKAGSDVLLRIAGQGLEGAYDVSNITYDANGNIKTLNRNKNNGDDGTAMDKLTYKYNDDRTETGPNRLNQVIDTDKDVNGADDIDTQEYADNYTYNLIGQLIENKQEKITYTYNTSGLVTEVVKNDVTLVKFFYNDRNHRVKKETYSSTLTTKLSSTYYVRDASGQVIAIYNEPDGGSAVAAEYPVYGSGRVGIYKPGTTPVTLYELTDHLGNVRAVFSVNDVNSSMANEGYSDYYPFGMKMPGRNMVGDYRYAFQGQEKDSETGKEAFELRLWDSRIGRWLSPDPYGEFSSPYLGMGNNPLAFVDIDGGRIILAYENQRYEYRNGQLFDGKGNLYTGNNQFLVETRNALSTLDYVSSSLESQAGGSLRNNGIINSIVESKDVYRIVYKRRKHHTNGATTRIDNKASVKTPTSDGIITSPYAITLVHELGHQFSGHNGFKNRNEWFNLEGQSVSFDENFASNFENIFRSSLNLPLRTHYSILDNKPFGEIFTPHGLFFNKTTPTTTTTGIVVGETGIFGGDPLNLLKN